MSINLQKRVFVSRPTTSLVPRVGVAALSSPLEVGAHRAGELAENLERLLGGSRCEVVALGPISDARRAAAAGRVLVESHVDVVALAVASWFEDYLVVDLLEECPVPVLLWSVPGMETGALCGTQQLTSLLKYLEVPFRCVHGEIEQGKCLDRAIGFLQASALKSTLRRARIGLAGHRIDGMTHAAANEFAMKKVIGARIIPLDTPRILDSADKMPEDECRRHWEHIVDNSAACHVCESDGLEAMQLYAALKQVVEDKDLMAIAVGCYPHLMGKVCLASSLLADEGIPLACEGDVNGAVGQLILTLLTGQPTHNADWLEPLEDGTMIFTHCGSGSFSLADSKENIVLKPVRLMEQGVCAHFPARTGPVTLISLTPTNSGYQCALLEGEAVNSTMVFPGNPVRVKFSRPVEELMDWVHNEGISHHWMIGYGHVGRQIREWAAIVGASLRLVEP